MDPSLWFIVREGDEIAAVLRGEPNRFDAGWVGAIGVRKPWRKRGLGLALLHHAFGEFYRRGRHEGCTRCRRAESHRCDAAVRACRHARRLRGGGVREELA